MEETQNFWSRTRFFTSKAKWATILLVMWHHKLVMCLNLHPCFSGFLHAQHHKVSSKRLHYKTTININCIIRKFCCNYAFRLARSHPFTTSTRRGEGVRPMWIHVGGRDTQNPKNVREKGSFLGQHVDVHKGCRLMWTGGGGQKPDFRVDVINGWPPILLCILQ